MKYHFFYLFLFLSLQLVCFSQVPADSLNQRNAKHKKQGLWKVYLNEQLAEADDSASSYYYAYSYYDNGTLVIFAGCAPRYKKKTIKVTGEGVNTRQGLPVLLNGTFKQYHKKGLALEETYKDGLPVKLITYNPAVDGVPVIIEIMDYNKPYQGQVGSAYYEYFNPDGSIRQKFWFAKNKKGKWTYINE